MTTQDAERLKAGLAEDEVVAKRAESSWQEDGGTGVILVSDGAHPAEPLIEVHIAGLAPHIARHDPTRAFADIAAKRHILALYEKTAAIVANSEERLRAAYHPPAGSIVNRDYLDGNRELAVLAEVVAALAAVYQDAPAETAH